jgi:hypothetical protein
LDIDIDIVDAAHDYDHARDHDYAYDHNDIEL